MEQIYRIAGGPARFSYICSAVCTFVYELRFDRNAITYHQPYATPTKFTTWDLAATRVWDPRFSEQARRHLTGQTIFKIKWVQILMESFQKRTRNCPRLPRLSA